MAESTLATLIDNFSLREELLDVTDDMTHESVIAMILHVDTPLIVALDGPMRHEVLTPVSD
jgi:hypothetical protein